MVLQFASPPLSDSHFGLAELQNSLEGLLNRSPETCGDGQSPALASHEISAVIRQVRVLKDARKMRDVDLQCDLQKWTRKANLAKAQKGKFHAPALHLDKSEAKSRNCKGASLYAVLVRKPLSPERELQKRLAQQAATVAQASTVQQILAEGPTAATHAIRGAAVQIGLPTAIAGNQVRAPIGFEHKRQTLFHILAVSNCAATAFRGLCAQQAPAHSTPRRMPIPELHIRSNASHQTVQQPSSLAKRPDTLQQQERDIQTEPSILLQVSQCDALPHSRVHVKTAMDKREFELSC